MTDVAANIEAHSASFTGFSISTAWHKLATLSRRGLHGAAGSRRSAARLPAVRRLMDLTEQRVSDLSVRQAATTLWAWAALGAPPRTPAPRPVWMRLVGGCDWLKLSGERASPSPPPPQGWIRHGSCGRPL